MSHSPKKFRRAAVITKLGIIFGIFQLFFLNKLFALDLLPYSIRKNHYSAWSTTTQGDIRTVGMAGATVGLADTFIAALDNPAGLAMTLKEGDTNFASNSIYDANLQNGEQAIHTYDFGVALNTYPWGFSVGYVAPFVEEQTFGLPNTPNESTLLSVKTRQLHFSAAKVFHDDQFAVGASLILGQSEHQIEYTTPAFSSLSSSNHSYSIGASLGMSFQMPYHLLLGMSYNLPMHFNPNSSENPTLGVKDFFQPVHIPYRLGVGLGWIPNRFFRADASLFMVGANEEAALLRNDSISKGHSVTVHPRLGIAYIFLDFHNLRGTAFLGMYYETSRIQGNFDRLHQTAGVEFKPWIFTLGWGIDSSHNYKNYLFSFGVDIFKVMQKLELIPVVENSAHGGTLPPPTEVSDEGLPRPLTKEWNSQEDHLNAIQIGLRIPKQIKKKAKQLQKTVKKAFTSEKDQANTSKKRKNTPPPRRIKSPQLIH